MVPELLMLTIASGLDEVIQECVKCQEMLGSTPYHDVFEAIQGGRRETGDWRERTS